MLLRQRLNDVTPVALLLGWSFNRFTLAAFGHDLLRAVFTPGI
jgi:hypothetical protein